MVKNTLRSFNKALSTNEPYSAIHFRPLSRKSHHRIKYNITFLSKISNLGWQILRAADIKVLLDSLI
jgi:hypothetical protein